MQMTDPLPEGPPPKKRLIGKSTAVSGHCSPAASSGTAFKKRYTEQEKEPNHGSRLPAIYDDHIHDLKRRVDDLATGREARSATGPGQVDKSQDDSRKSDASAGIPSQTALPKDCDLSEVATKHRRASNRDKKESGKAKKDSKKEKKDSRSKARKRRDGESKKKPSRASPVRLRPRKRGSEVVQCQFRPETDPAVIFEGERVMVVYKPPYWTTTTDADAEWQRAPLQGWLWDNFGDRFPIFGDSTKSNGLCQRLDVQTSGPLIVAKDVDAWKSMRHDIAEKSARKEYWALMHGTLTPSKSKGILNYPILKIKNKRGNPRVVSEVHRENCRCGCQHAQTFYEVEQYYKRSSSGERYTLLKVRIITGRTHQIRVHVAELARRAHMKLRGLVGDFVYLDSKQYKKDRSFCPRVFLHAKSLEVWPVGESQPFRIECDLPDDLQRVLDGLQRDAKAHERLSKM
jgi:23S rRNA-/tRNA-specific pseudouridylate synthase